MATDAKRSVRVAEGIREELSLLFVKELRDPRVQGALVSRVVLSDDLRSAKVYVRTLDGGDDEGARARLLEGLGRAAGMLRREVTQRLSLRFAPELRFYYDEGQDKAQRIEELLHEVRKDRRE